jgi:hypothetical protein|tara:strand:- start:218 stop:637 length:420 start_codon:yes stop_codon:yes gene_type:complete
MAAIDLNTVRAAIEGRVATELANSPAIPVVFHNMSFDSNSASSFVQCLTSFGETNYLTMGNASGQNRVNGIVVFNIFTPQGVGSGNNYTIGKRLRDLYNRITVSNVIFDSPIGSEVVTPSLEGKFQTQLRMTFEIFEEL